MGAGKAPTESHSEARPSPPPFSLPNSVPHKGTHIVEQPRNQRATQPPCPWFPTPFGQSFSFLSQGGEGPNDSQHKQGLQRMRACTLNPLLSINNWEKDTTGTQTLCIFQTTELKPTDRWGQTAASRCLCYCQLEAKELRERNKARNLPNRPGFSG